MSICISELISKKRDGLELTDEEIEIFINAVVRRTIKEPQTGAMLMAMFLNNLSFHEVVTLTKAMAKSGEILALKEFGNKMEIVDKHSTGGVGDKVSLILTPALASLGLKVPMMSGWSLNHTGGTLNKLQSIPGFQVSLTAKQMKDCLTEAGCFICSSSSTFAPADSILYKLREMTATVDNYGLIVSSILSKKIAEGIGILIVDVKYGRGSFQKTLEDAKYLADTLVRQTPLEAGTYLAFVAGNALEVLESVKCLRNEVNGNGDLMELVKLLGAVVLESKGAVSTISEGKMLIYKTLQDGSALNSFKKMLTAQGVTKENASALCSGHFWRVLPRAPHTSELLSPASGVVVNIDSLNIGKACWLLSGGRTEQVDSSVGVVLLKLLGDKVEEKEPWIQVHHATQVLSPEIEDLIKQSLKVDSENNRKTKHMTMMLHA